MMHVLFTKIRRLASCCSKNGILSRYQPSDEQEDYYDEELQKKNSEAATLLSTSLKSRIAQYEQQLEDSNNKKTLNNNKNDVDPYQRSNSTSNIISQYEQRMTPNKEEKIKAAADISTTKQSLFQRSNTPTINYKKCAACEKLIYPTDPITSSFGNTLHSSCFCCHLCGSRMNNHPMEVQFTMPNTDSLYLLCSKCQEQSIHQHKPKVLATEAGKAITIDDDEQGDVDGVKDAIGDELEEILMDKHIPKCATCGGDFLNYTTGTVAMVGQMKYHQECWETGKPMDLSTMSERQLTPPQAARYLPERLICKLSNNDTRKPMTTLFFVWATKAQDVKRLIQAPPPRQDSSSSLSPAVAHIQYQLDENAVGNPNYTDPGKRKTQVAVPSSTTTTQELQLSWEFIGSPFGTKSIELVNVQMVEIENNNLLSSMLVARMILSKFQLQHVILLQIPAIPSSSSTMDEKQESGLQLDLTRARLVIEI